MTNIRAYMDMIDRELNEGFFSSRNTPTQPARPTQVSSQGGDQHRQLEIAKKYDTAEEYAEDMNRYSHGRSFDPQNLKDEAQREENRLLLQWRTWKEKGLI